MFKYSHFHEDHGHETNQCREIKEVVKSTQLAHLVQGIKKAKAKSSDTFPSEHSAWIPKVHLFVSRESIPSLLESSLWKSPELKKNRRRLKKPSLRLRRTFSAVWTRRKGSSLMKRIPRTIMVGEKPFNTEHKLKEYTHIKPVKQKKRGLAQEQNESACKEVDELTKEGILWEVKYQTWVANPIMVKKSDGGWRMCVDFTDITEMLPGCLQGLPFLSKGVDKSLPFIKELKSCIDKKTIQWTADAEEVFQKMNEFIEILPTLTTSIKGKVVFQRVELDYPELEKLILALVHTARRLQRYFQAHFIRILADFLAETSLAEGIKMETKKFEVANEEPKSKGIWKLYTYGASSSNGSGTGLRIVEELEIKELAIFIDSQLVANQVKGLFKARKPTIMLQKTREVLKSFDTYSMEHIRRNQNKKVDALSKLASITFEHLTKEVLVEVLANRSINNKEVSKILAKVEEN
ncbi:reverse transcriptase domain-containing protein [Tanacetum coccineum]